MSEWSYVQFVSPPDGPVTEVTQAWGHTESHLQPLNLRALQSPTRLAPQLSLDGVTQPLTVITSVWVQEPYKVQLQVIAPLTPRCGMMNKRHHILQSISKSVGQPRPGHGHPKSQSLWRGLLESHKVTPRLNIFCDS